MSPGVAHHGCCCGCPCSEYLLNATVTISGTCTDDGECEYAEGSYSSWNSGQAEIDGETVCYWQAQYDGPGGYYIIGLFYCPSDARWYSAVYPVISGGFYGFAEHVRDMHEVTGDVLCEDGIVEGVYDLPGQLVGSTDCVGCTATVTLT